METDFKSIKKESKGTKNIIYNGNNFPDNLLNNIQDSIVIYLAQSSSPFTIVDSAKSILSNSGIANCIFPNATYGSYFIISRQRNHIETWSSSAINFTSGSTINYDFTTSQSQAFGSNQIQIGSVWCIYSGDVNQDEVIDASDMSEVDNDAYNSVSGYVRTDITGDDFVDAADMSIVDNNAYNSVSVIRP